MDRYGPEAINWAPATWAQEIADDCGVSLPQRNADKIAAACVLLCQPHEYYTSPASFTDIITGLSAEWFDTTVWHPPTTQECAWGLIEAHLISPPDPDEKFSPDVVRYVNMIARNDGFHTLPGVFRTFGVSEDPYLPAPHDYSADPDVAAAVASGVNDQERDLSKFIVDKLTDLADRLMTLPLRDGKNLPAVVEQIRKAVYT